MIIRDPIGIPKRNKATISSKTVRNQICASCLLESFRGSKECSGPKTAVKGFQQQNKKSTRALGISRGFKEQNSRAPGGLVVMI